MADAKICPMMSRPISEYSPLSGPSADLHIVECPKEKCAWWADNFGVCAIKGIDDSLNNMDE
ncbi:hypothetical protein [Candidatus Contubernalis alkaliaceticus]|uniref:hypothetical protein n=1 Tax=Candidatus Contubernalis alkaliaceticus TaxID=338645 RepID=UPI001F4BD9EF|nr:hypothetical protein [Candidatus Contubernalis alkalaceticus]UNC91662.1 hypothetical protein HUE98_05885 [Candidatus Contubernalis alkalaceticus]